MDVFNLNGCQYRIKRGDVYLHRIIDPIYHLIIPNNNKAKLKNFGKYETKFPAIISFEEPSEITEVETSIIGCCKSIFNLPSSVKRVTCNFSVNKEHPIIVCDKKNMFVSTSNKRSIINNHPFELIYQCSPKPRLSIRETVQIIGKQAYNHNFCLISVVFPASVELVDDLAFYCCHMLRNIEFKSNSMLKRIGNGAFSETNLEIISFPAKLKELGRCAFNKCQNLYFVSFPKNSKLGKIGDECFSESAIEYIEFPTSIKEIGHKAFKKCYYLSSVSFSTDSKLEKIGEGAFVETSIKKIEFPSSLIEICQMAFKKCQRLSSITFDKDSKLKIIGCKAFQSTRIESIEFPSSLETIGDDAFRDCFNLKYVSYLQRERPIDISESAFEECCEQIQAQ